MSEERWRGSFGKQGNCGHKEVIGVFLDPLNQAERSIVNTFDWAKTLCILYLRITPATLIR